MCKLIATFGRSFCWVLHDHARSLLFRVCNNDRGGVIGLVREHIVIWFAYIHWCTSHRSLPISVSGVEELYNLIPDLNEQLRAVILRLALVSRLSARCNLPNLALREAVERLGVSRNRVSNEPRVDLPSSNVDITHIIAQLVVARIVPVASLATKHLGFLLGLDTLSTRSDAAGGDPGANETVVVAPAVEGDKSVVQTVRLVPVDVQIPQLLGSNGAGVVGGVVDLVGEVRGAHHVVVHEEADLLVFLRRQGSGVEVGADEAFFFGGPPGEAHAVVDVEGGEVGCDFEQGQGSGAVVVDAGAFRYAVGVGAEDDAVFGVAASGLGDDVQGVDGLDFGVDVGDCVDLLAGLELLERGLGFLEGDAKGGDLVIIGSAHGAVQGSVLVVEDDGGGCAGAPCKRGLVAEAALASLHESDVAFDGVWVVRGRAAAVGHEDDIAVDRLVVLGWRSQAHGGCIANDLVCENKTRLSDIARVGREGLLGDVVVAAQLLDGGVDVFQCSLVAGTADDSRRVVLVVE
jgi:hypothetical protein